MVKRTPNLLDEIQTKILIESLLPEIHIRDIGLSILADGIIEANFHSRDNWAVTCAYPDSIWFQVGRYATLTFDKNGIWLALDKQLIDTPIDNEIAFLSENEYGWRPDQEGTYQFKDKHKPGSPMSINGWYTPISYEAHDEIWPYMRRLFHEFIFRANYIGQKTMLPATKKIHNVGTLIYLRNTLGKHVPDPLYG